MPLRPPRILIIEDEYLIAAMLEGMLESLGCEVVGPITSLDAAMEHCSNSDIDGAILNLVLQGEPAGDVARVLAGRGIPFGFASGMNHAHSAEEWKARPYLEKPYTLADVRALILAILPDHTPIPSAQIPASHASCDRD